MISVCIAVQILKYDLARFSFHQCEGKGERCTVTGLIQPENPRADEQSRIGSPSSAVCYLQLLYVYFPSSVCIT